MWEFFLSLVQVNESINYTLIISVIVSYFLLIWFVVCVWVFFDAHKRYGSIVTPILFTLFSSLFGPPALIIYIMIRPEHTLEEDYYMGLSLSGEKEMRPIYFDGEKGFDVSFNISVQPKVGEAGKHKMELDMAWVPEKINVIKKKQTMKERRSSDRVVTKLKEYWNKFVKNVNKELTFIGTKAKKSVHKGRRKKSSKKIKEFKKIKDKK